MTMNRGLITRLMIGGLLAVLAVSCDTMIGPTEIQVSYRHYRAAWSPDSTSIAFIANINNTLGIYAVDTSGSNLRLVYAGDTGGPTWSPDSKWLAFSRFQTIWKVKANGDSLQQLTTGSGDVRPSWSRDGKTIAFVRTGIWLLDVATDSARLLVEAGDFPSWHPNGTDVVMQTISGNGTIANFYTIHKDSGLVRILFTVSAPGVCSFSSISPTVNELLFSLTPFEGITQIWRIDITTSTSQQLSDDGGDFASWSPDGSKIVYTRTAFGDGALWIVNKDGSGRRRLTTP